MPPKRKTHEVQGTSKGVGKARSYPVGRKKIVARKGIKPRRGTKRQVKKLPLVPKVPVEEPIPQHTNGKRDIVCIIALWSVDVLYILARASKDLLFRRQLTNRNVYDDTTFLGVSNVVWIIMATFLFTVEVVLFSRNWRKFNIVLVGLSVYAISILCVLLYIQTQNFIVAIISSWLEIGWHIVYPMKFFLIFHQRFPISVLHSRILTSTMQTITYLVLYLSTIFVTQSDGFPTKTFRLILLAFLVIMVIWVIVVFLVKRWSLETPIEADKVYAFYRREDVVQSYMHRHKGVIVFHFAVLLIPSVMFVILAHATTVALFPFRDHFFVHYRLDMAIGLILALLVQCVIWFIKAFRDEVKDLYAIGTIHFFSVISLVIFLIIAPVALRTDESRGRQLHMNLRSRQIQMDFLPACDERQGYEVSVNGEVAERYGLGFSAILYTTEAQVQVRVNGTLKFDNIFHLNPTKNFFPYYLNVRTFEIKRISLSHEFKYGYCGYKFLNTLDACNEPGAPAKYIVPGEKCVEVKQEILYSRNGQETIEMADLPPTFESDIMYVPYIEEEQLNITRNLLYSGDFYVEPASCNGTIYWIQFSLYCPNEIVIIGYQYNYTTPAPTLAPTPAPTLAPTPAPTLAPTPAPTLAPTPAPTLAPTPAPTLAPTPAPTLAPTPAPAPIPKMFPNLLIPMAILTSIGFALARISYIHFIWITAPFEHRLVILGVFFARNHLVEQLAQLDITSTSRGLIIVLLIAQIFFFIYHILLTIAFRRRLPTLTHVQKQPPRKF